MARIEDPAILEQIKQPGGKITDPAILQQVAPDMTAEQKNLIKAPFDWGKALSNAPQSAVNLAEAVLLPVYRPDEFLKGMGNMLGAMGEKSAGSIMESIIRIGGKATGQTKEDSTVDIPSPKFDALIAPYKKKYESEDSFYRATEQDPFGTVADALAVLYGAKGLYKGAKNVMGRVPKSTSIKMLEEVAKITDTKEFRNPATRQRVIESWLKEGIPLTEKGVSKLNTIVRDINSQIDGLIAQVGPTKTVPRTAVLRNIKEYRKTLDGLIDSEVDLRIVDRAINNYIKTVERQSSPNMTIAELNQFKKNAAGKVTDWSPQKSNVVKTQDEYYKNVSGEAREMVGEAVPGAVPLNKRQAPLLQGREQLQKSVNRINKHNKVLNLSALVGTGTGELIGSMLGAPGVGTAIGAGAYAIGRPGVKGSMAQALYNARKARLSGGISPEIDLTKAMAAAYLANPDKR